MTHVPASFNNGDFHIEGGLLVRYRGPGGDVVIPEGVSRVGYQAFKDCESLESLVIPDSVARIGVSAFRGCGSLRSLVLPAGLSRVEMSSFANCRSLRDLTIPYGVTSIGPAAFCHCRSLERLVIPGSVTSIYNSAFYGCVGLKALSLPESVAAISESAFRGCTGLESLAIHNPEARIEKDAFKDCPPYVKCFTPAAACQISRPVYLGGSLTDLKEEKQADAVRGFIHARMEGAAETDRRSGEYLDYIRKAPGPFLEAARADREVLQFLLREELAGREETRRLLEMFTAARDTEGAAMVLEYAGKTFGPDGPGDFSL